MDKILFATDGSNYSEHAAQLAEEFLHAWPEAKLIVLYVTSKETYAYDLIPDVVDKAEKEVTSKIEKDIKERLFPNDQDRLTILHKVGHASITICETAEETGADLIIVSSHGRGIVDRALLGSVATGVLHRSKVPVLIAKQKI